MTAGAPPSEAGRLVNSGNYVRRVALVLSELRAGGAERVVVHLAKAFSAMGVAVRVFCLRRKGELSGDLESAGLPVAALNSLKRYDLPAVAALRRQIRSFRADVVNVHDLACLPYVHLACRLLDGMPVVFTAHGLLMRSQRPRWRDRWAAQCLAAVTAVSEPAAQEYARLLGWRHGVTVIDNGVPPVERSDGLRQEVRKELGLSPETIVFLAVGNIKPEKGFADLVDAAGVLRQRMPDRPFAVLIAGGPTDRDCWDAILNHVGRLGLQGHVRLLGYRSDAQSLYSAADAFVLSSRKEGLPLVLLEAMSARLPVLATRVGAVSTVVEDGVHGLLVEAVRPDQLAEAMFGVAGDAAWRSRLGEAAARLVESRYGVGRMAGAYLAAYRSALVGVPGVRVAGNPGGPRVLHLGPQTPLTGGMATVVDNLFSSELGRDFELIGLNTGKVTRAGRTVAEGVWAQLALLSRLARIIRQQKVAACHIHTCSYFVFWRDCAHALLARWLGCRVAWHVHGGRFDQWARQRRRLGKWVIRAAFEGAGATIVLSPQWLRQLQPFAPGARWHVVENGVPMPSSSDPLSPGPTRFLFLGDWGPRKGVRELVAATAKAAREHGFNGQARLAGTETEPGQLQAIAKVVSQSGCGEQIVVLGPVAGAAKERELRGCHCLVLPSYGEGLPMAILEAMSHGRAVIATTVGAIPELVVDGVHGFLIAPGDVGALADRMARLDRDRSLLERMGAAARQQVEGRYSLSEMARRVREIYEQVLPGFRASSG